MDALSKNKKKKLKKKKKKLQLQDEGTTIEGREEEIPDIGRVDDTKPKIDIKIEEEWRQQGEELNETMVREKLKNFKQFSGFLYG